MVLTAVLLATLFHIQSPDTVKRYAVLDSTTDTVRNIALWDGVAQWTPGAGYWCMPCGDTVSIGEAYVKKQGKYIFTH